MINKIFKQKVFEVCNEILEQRIANAKQAMQNAQEAANSEDKSSAGDKYETSRAMGQLDRNMNAKQLAEGQSELNSILKMNIEIESDKVINGSVVKAKDQIYFVAVGIGGIEVEGQKIIVLSPKSPLGIAIHGKKVGEKFLFNGKEIEVKEIF